MKLDFLNKLSFRQARNAFFISILLGLITGIMQVSSDYKKAYAEIDSIIYSNIDMLTSAAQQSVYDYNDTYAKDIVEGLAKHKVIWSARIYDERGNPFGEAGQLNEEQKKSWWLFGKAGIKKYEKLLLQDDEQIGVLEINANVAAYIGDSIKRMRMVLLWDIVRNIILVTFISFMFYYSVSLPLQKIGDHFLNTNFETLKERAFVVPKGHEKDEIGGLVRALNNMTNRLCRVLEKTIDAVQRITKSSIEISDATKQQYVNVQTRSSAVTETSASAQELAKLSENVSGHIQRVMNVTEHAVTGMDKIKTSIHDTSVIINSLGEKSEKISIITQVIDEITQKTNMLAINAAIEASRAGEFEKTFGVVANEIRDLSDSTAKSTKEINSLIELIQQEISNAVICMEDNVSYVSEEMSLSHESKKVAKEISMSAGQQLQGAKQIAEAMQEIDVNIKQVVYGIEQTEGAASQLKHLANELEVMYSSSVSA